MPRLYYKDSTKNRRPETLAIIRQADNICAEYAAQGFDLTLRQLYYQFVARGFIPNKQTEYKRLGSIINDARLAGLLDWDYIVDRGRNLESRPSWSGPDRLMQAAARSFHRDLWADQKIRVEVWIEKEALAGVIEPVCQELDVAYFPCKGYTSQSEMWSAGQRLGKYLAGEQEVVILHLGDHDPSGIDMTRDIQDRLDTFLWGDWVRTKHAVFMEEHLDVDEESEDGGGDEFNEWLRKNRDGQWSVSVERVALNMDQVQEYNPPPNPAKVTDSRFESYRDEYGEESWELDALDPTTLARVIRTNVEQYMNFDLFEDALQVEIEQRELIERCANRWEEVVEFLEAA